jgi:hypothetical protein
LRIYSSSISYLRISSTLSSQNRASLEPQRDVGRRRVAELLQAAAAVLQERGFEAATMAEIAARADAKIGQLPRIGKVRSVLRRRAKQPR